jgi:hypothetical protein
VLLVELELVVVERLDALVAALRAVEEGARQHLARQLDAHHHVLDALDHHDLARQLQLLQAVDAVLATLEVLVLRVVRQVVRAPYRARGCRP